MIREKLMSSKHGAVPYAAAEKDHIGTDFTQGPVMPLLIRFLLPFLLVEALRIAVAITIIPII